MLMNQQNRRTHTRFKLYTVYRVGLTDRESIASKTIFFSQRLGLIQGLRQTYPDLQFLTVRLERLSALHVNMFACLYAACLHFLNVIFFVKRSPVW